MTTVLVSGAAAAVTEVAEALRTRGAEVTEVVDLAEVPAVCAAAGKGAFASYVQLPATFQIRGETAVDRVHHFYADGVLARFPALAAALPSLTDVARVTFVLGRLPGDVSTPDDVQARLALTKVLGHAARADRLDGRLMVRVLEATATAEEIAGAALGERLAQHELLDRLADLRYEDWRVELLGLVSMEA
jgi:hypothetical protein